MRQNHARELSSFGLSFGLFSALMLSLTACKTENQQDTTTNNPIQSSSALKVLAGSELQDLGSLIQEIERKANVKLKMQYTGTLSATESLVAGTKTDFAWLSHGKYLSLQEGLKSSILATEKTMLSPVVLGVKQSLAKKWGWDKNKEITWKDITAKAASGELKYAMTNPSSSNSGFTALVGVTAALNGNSDALTSSQISGPEIKRFLKGQALNSGSSGFLASLYIREEDKLGGMINYESVLLNLNETGNLKEKLTLIYPKEGIITADYPIMLFNKNQREAYQRLVNVILSPDIQEKITERTLRRPVVTGVAANPRIPNNLLIEMPFPGKLSVLDEILSSYANKNRIPHHATFVLDVSGSMKGNRLRNLVNSIKKLAGQDQTLTGRYARFSDREIVTMMPFSSSHQSKVFRISKGEKADITRNQIINYVEQLKAHGGTALYDTLKSAYQDLKSEVKQSNANKSTIQRTYSIVVMTDGKVTKGMRFNEFSKFYEGLSNEVKSIKIYPILFGDSNHKEMEKLAGLSGGRTFNGHKDLAIAFKQIRGYQ